MFVQYRTLIFYYMYLLLIFSLNPYDAYLIFHKIRVSYKLNLNTSDCIYIFFISLFFYFSPFQFFLVVNPSFSSFYIFEGRSVPLFHSFLSFFTSLFNLLQKQSMTYKKVWGYLKLKIMINIIYKPLKMLIVNIIVLLILRLVMTNEIYAEGMPWLGVFTGTVIQDFQEKGLVQGVNGEWYDPNDLIEDDSTESTSDSESEDTSKITNGFHFKVLELLDLQITKCYTSSEIFHTCMEMVQNTVPQDIWSTNESELSNPDSIVNSYLTDIQNHIHQGDETVTFTYFQAAVATYNTGQLFGVLHNDDLLYKVFENAVYKSFSSST